MASPIRAIRGDYAGDLQLALDDLLEKLKALDVDLRIPRENTRIVIDIRWVELYGHEYRARWEAT